MPHTGVRASAALACVFLTTSCFNLPQSSANDATILLLQGRWEIVGGVNQGRELTPAEVAGTYVTVTTNSIVTFDVTDQQRYRAVFVLDDTKKPVEITMTSLSSDPTTEEKPIKQKNESPASNVATGILKFDGDEKWVLCYALPGADRPTEFKSAAESKTMLFVLERKPSKVDGPDALQ